MHNIITSAIYKRYVNNVVKEQLVTYITLNDNLNYEYKRGDEIKPIFITGKTLEEQELPSLPIPAKITIGKNTYLVIDARMFVSASVDDELKSKIKDATSFSIYEAITALTIEAEEIRGVMARLRGYTVELGGIWLTNSIATSLHLDMAERTTLNLIVSNYLLAKYGIESDAIYINLMDKTTLYTDRDSAEDVFKKLKYKAPTTLKELSENIINVFRSRKVAALDESLIVASLRNSFFGANSDQLTILAFEHMPTLTAILYIAANNRAFRRSKVGSIVLDNHKRLELDNMTTIVNGLVRDIKK